MSFPSIVPNIEDRTLYFVLKDFGRYGPAFIETDPVENSREAVIDAIASGDLDDVLQVVAVDILGGTARDVTKEIMAAAEMQASA